MHRLAGPLVRGNRLRVGYQRGTATFALPYLLPLSDARNTPRQEANVTIEPTLHTARHEISSTYFDSKRNDLIKLDGGDPKTVVHRFRQALEQRNVTALHLAYAELRVEAIQLKDPSYASSQIRAQSMSKLRVDDIRAAMQLALGPVDSYVSHSSKSKNKTSEKSREEEEYWPRRSSATKGKDGKLVQQMFQDMEPVFGFTVEKRDCKRSVLSYSMQTRSSQKVFSHLQQLRSKFECYQDSVYSDEGALIMSLCDKEANGIQVAKRFWSMLEENKVKIIRSTRDLFIRLLFKAGDVKQAMDIAQQGSGKTEWFSLVLRNLSSLSMFLEGIARAGHGHWPLAVKMADEVQKQASKKKTLLSISSWHNLLIYIAIVKKPTAALDLAESAHLNGLLPTDEETFTVLLSTHQSQLVNIARGGTEEDVMRLFSRIEAKCHVAPPISSYTIAIHALLGKKVPSLLYGTDYQQESSVITEDEDETLDEVPFINRRSVPKHTPGQIYEASLLYQRIRAQGMKPTSDLVSPLIVAYTSTYIPQAERALELYQDWRSFGARLPIGIYNILLFTCAKAKKFTAAQEIIQDMISIGVSLNHRALADLVVLLMEASYSYQDAHEIYSRVRDAAEDLRGSNIANQNQKVVVFDELGWLKIIDRFSKLKFDQDSSPPIELLLEMLIDMRASGFAPEPKQYTSLLKLFGGSATTALTSLNKFDPDDNEAKNRVFAILEEVRGAIFSIHNYIQREESIEPDLILITALMDAYNRVGRSQFALEIWHRLILNKTLVDSACIAVILDTCGHDGLIHEARRAWKWVHKEELQKQQINKGVWDAWIECLARCGYLLEAIDTAFLEMTPALKDVSQGPDVKTMEMLLRFASSEKNRWNRDSNEEFYLLGHLKKRLQAEMPYLWDQVKVIHIPLVDRLK